MTSNHVKQNMHDLLNKDIIIDYNLGRNKNEIIEGKIKNLYNYIFTVETKDKNLKSFSYADVITKTIKISVKH